MHKKLAIIIVLLVILIALLYGLVDTERDRNLETRQAVDTSETPIDMLKANVAEIFTRDCATSGCHQGSLPKANLNLEKDAFIQSILDVPSRQINSLKLVDLQNPAASYLLMKIKGAEGIAKDRMPINAPPLKAADIELIDNWIKALAAAQSATEETEPIKP